MRTTVKVVRAGRRSRVKITTASAVHRLLRKEIVGLDREHLWRIDLDSHDRLIAWELVAIGSVSRVIAEPREIFKGAILNGASRIVLVHNHPSQRVQPTEGDDGVTARVLIAGALLGVGLRDHVVVTDRHSYSYRQSGKLDEIAKDVLSPIEGLEFEDAR